MTQVKSALYKITNELKQAIQNAATLRKEHLWQLANVAAADAQSYITKIINAEEIRQLFRKLKYLRTQSTQ